MRLAIYLIGSADGAWSFPSGTMVKSYDPDGHGGIGDVDSTTDPAKALTFPSMVEAMECWRQVSKVQPLRPDGKPNRPLTAYTIEIKETT